MFYIKFIGFILCEEDKTSRTSIEYWFKVLDLDDNGIVTYNYILRKKFLKEKILIMKLIE